jgi:S-adenosylmethionine:tRNA ribosyltransferase-isomerase
MRLDDFDYPLPPELIAQAPADRRDASRLLVVPRSGPLAHRRFSDLPSVLPAGALLVVNDARVVPARLHARKATGGAVEIFAVERRAADAGGETWVCLVKGAKSLAPGAALTLEPPRGRAPSSAPPGVRFLGREGEDALVRFDAPLLPALDDWGEIPLPPYIAREAGPTEEDRDRYQTVFARAPGAVAAPTAGLHFTGETLAALEARGIERVAVTLHVGPGTFAPVRGDLHRHVMHAERYDVPAATAAAVDAARAAGRPVVAVGTTVVRTLESARREDGTIAPGPGETRLFLHPGVRVEVADLLVTNFHLPRSTLLMLVMAFAGRERILEAYGEAVAARYRFFSYGDAMLLERAAA